MKRGRRRFSKEFSKYLLDERVNELMERKGFKEDLGFVLRVWFVLFFFCK